MIAGNLAQEPNNEVYYLSKTFLPFIHKGSQRRIIFSPHQIKTLDNQNYRVFPVEFDGQQISINCPCNQNGVNIIDELIKKNHLSNTILWVDPTNLPIECLASIIFSWNVSSQPHNNVSLGIVAPKNEAIVNKTKFTLWKPGINGSIPKNKPKNIIWYPSLLRDSNFLYEASKTIDPYDIYPILDFSRSIIQTGERDLTNHAVLLEEFRTRTRHFIMLNPNHPEKSFRDLYGTLNSTPRSGYLSLNPVLTPGGNSINYLLMMIVTVLSDSYFLSPHNEIPINSNDDPHGIFLLRKCF